MERMVNQLSSGDNSSIRKQLNDVTHYTGQLAKDTSEDLKDLNKFPVGDQRQLKLQREKLTSDFSTVLNSFQQIQRRAAAREKELMKAARQDDEQQQPQLLQLGQPTSRQIFAEEDNVSELLERENSIRQLETDILSVNQIFQELAKMVHEQGEVIDSIEAHVEEAQITTQQGTEELSRAATYQSKARRKKAFIFGVLILILIIFILILVYT
jgi:t-SNARE complex subunit (syntaxin)